MVACSEALGASVGRRADFGYSVTRLLVERVVQGEGSGLCLGQVAWLAIPLAVAAGTRNSYTSIRFLAKAAKRRFC